MIKLGELKALRSKMEHTPWDCTTPHAVSNDEYDLGRFDGPADASGVVACVNAIDVLIEIAEAALAWEAAKLAERDARGQLYVNDDPTQADARSHREANRVLDRCQDAYRTALAKVQL